MIIFLGGAEFQEAKAAHVTAEATRSGTVIISTEASTALCSTRCSAAAAYSCISPSEGLCLTGCDAAILHFTAFRSLVDIRLKLWQKPEQVQLLLFFFSLFIHFNSCCFDQPLMYDSRSVMRCLQPSERQQVKCRSKKTVKARYKVV